MRIIFIILITLLFNQCSEKKQAADTIFINGNIYTVSDHQPKTEAIAIIDGRSYIALKPRSIVEATISENITRFIRFKPFYSRIQRRLMNLQTSGRP